jgi:hypothetical protein
MQFTREFRNLLLQNIFRNNLLLHCPSSTAQLKQSVSEGDFASILRWVGSENTPTLLQALESSTQSLAKVAESPEDGSRAGFRKAACFNCTVDGGRSAKEVCVNVTPSSKPPEPERSTVMTSTSTSWTFSSSNLLGEGYVRYEIIIINASNNIEVYSPKQNNTKGKQHICKHYFNL